MTLIVEDGTGLSTAESFCSIADATSYHAKYGNEAWLSQPDSEREIHLRRATQFLEAEFRGRWKGIRVKTEQALAWPRYDVCDEDEAWVSSSAVPVQVRDATAILALISATETLVPDLEAGAVKRERVKVGDIEEETEYVGAKRERKSYTLAEQMLRPLLEPAGRLYRA